MSFIGAGGFFPAGAQEGVLNSVGYEDIAPGTPIRVSPLDNSDQNLLLQELFERGLKAKGYAITRDANLVLSFESRNMVGAWTNGGVRTLIEFKNNWDRAGQDPPQVNLNIYNSSRGGLLNKGHSGGTSIVTPSHYRLDAFLDDSTSGQRIWQSWATADFNSAGSGAASQAMVPVMVDHLGSTVKNQPFSAR